MKFPEPTFMQNMENKTKIKFWSTPVMNGIYADSNESVIEYI